MSSGSSVNWSEMLFESFKKHGVLTNNSSTDKNWLVDSTLRENVQNGLMQFSKICLNLCSLRWLKPPRRRLIPYIKSGEGKPSLNKLFLNFLKDSSLRSCKSSLFHSQMV